MSLAPPMRASPMRRHCHTQATKCPSGHELTLWTARAGRCDGCSRLIAQGEQVMDCRACNWYLCEDCRPCTFEQAESLWGAISNLFFGDVCRAPSGLRESQANEVVIVSSVSITAEDSPDDPRMFRPKAARAELVESPAAEDAKRSTEAPPPPPPPTAAVRELTDLLDLSAEPVPSPKLDLSTVDFCRPDGGGGGSGGEVAAAKGGKAGEASREAPRGSLAAIGGA
mmetsp:Transcript_38758/g.99010  ORF Transcript_38758/g.99010 Transcript_38758/m.99010 type:complete len:226 (-) Transcript_38758:27-704(-)